MVRTPLLSRRLDTVYTLYFAIHLAASILVDAQLSFLPHSQRFYPTALRQALHFYLETFKDPFLGALARQDPSYAWFRMLVLSEVVLQIPVFVVAIVALSRDDKRIYPVFVAYATLAASSTAQCIGSLVIGNDGVGLSKGELFGLLHNYVPFCVLPCVLCVDMTLRIVGLISSSPSAWLERKSR